MLMEGYSKDQQNQFLADLEIFINELRPILTEKFGKIRSKHILERVKKEFETFIPEIPYIGGEENPLTATITSVSPYLVLCQVLKSEKMELEEIGEICLNHADNHYHNIQDQILSMDHPSIKKYLKYTAHESQKRKYPSDYVYEFIEGEEFDYGLDFKECAICKLFHLHNLDELTPYMCAMDFFESKYGGWGLHRSKTLAEGASKCDFRYKKGRKTKIVSSVLKE